MEAYSPKSGDTVTLVTEANGRIERSSSEFPECNALIPLWNYAEGSSAGWRSPFWCGSSRDVLPEIIEGGGADSR